jgi:hypothetical protein
MALSCRGPQPHQADRLPKSISDPNLRATEEYCDCEETAVTYKLPRSLENGSGGTQVVN